MPTYEGALKTSPLILLRSPVINWHIMQRDKVIIQDESINGENSPKTEICFCKGTPANYTTFHPCIIGYIKAKSSTRLSL